MPPAFVNRLRANSVPLNTVPPKPSSDEYHPELAALASRILYRSPLNSPADLPIYILDSAAFPNAKQEYYDQLLPYVLTQLPHEEELIGGLEYEIVFFAGGNPGSTYARKTSSAEDDEAEDKDEEQHGGIIGARVRRSKKPGFAWFMKAYNVLNRATRKRLKKLWIVHERRWVRVLVEMFATVVSPKFRKKVVHASSLTALALHLPIENLLVPPTAYYTDRKKVPDIYVPYASGKRAFGVTNPLPISADGEKRLPRVLREATTFLLSGPLIQTEGIFRVSARQQTVEVLREAYDRGQKFIIWKEASTVFTAPHYKEGSGEVAIDKAHLEELEGYDIHAAAALIKLWYKELKEPIFPPTSYQAVGKYYGNQDASFDFETLKQMLDPGVEYTVLPPMSRLILTTHLLPLLSDIANRSETNKMTPSNLAVCFAPILLCGPDPIEDVKISAIIRRILTAMIEKWSEELAPALALSNEKLEASLSLPSAVEDREDPIDESSTGSKSSQPYGTGANPAQISGIALRDHDSSSSEVPIEASDSSDNDDNDEDDTHPAPTRAKSGDGASADKEDDEIRPPLPPRPQRRAVTDPLASSDSIPSSAATTTTTTGMTSRADNPSIGTIQRKPAPPIHQPPRYSTIMTDHPSIMRGQRPTGTVEPEESGAGPHDHSLSHGHSNRDSVATLPLYEETQSAPPQTIAEESEAVERREEALGMQRGRNVSVQSIPRKPVGEGKAAAEKTDGSGEG